MIKVTKHIVSAFSNIKPAQQIIVQYEDLLTGKNIQPVIEQAYGPQGLFFIIKVSVFSLSKEFLTTPL